MNSKNIFHLILGLTVGYLLSSLSPFVRPFFVGVQLQDGVPDRFYIMLALVVLIPALIAYASKEKYPLFAKTLAIITIALNFSSHFGMTLGCLFSCREGEGLIAVLLPINSLAVGILLLWPFLYQKLRRSYFFISFAIVIAVTVVLWLKQF